MKWLSVLGVWITFNFSYACHLVLVSHNDPNMVFMASNIAKGLFFKSNCARMMEESGESVSSKTKSLMRAWNLSFTPSINLLTLDDVQSAKLILVFSTKDKQALDALYPEYGEKIQVMSECAKISSMEMGENLSQIREYLFRAEDLISANGWKCLNKEK